MLGRLHVLIGRTDSLGPGMPANAWSVDKHDIVGGERGTECELQQLRTFFLKDGIQAVCEEQ